MDIASTSALPPAYAFVQTHGNLLTQMGATKVEATDALEIKATFSSNSKAVNADALLKDTLWGAKLVIDNQSLTPDAPVASAHGIADVLRGVEGLSVSVAMRGGIPGPVTDVLAFTPNAELAKTLREFVEPKPTANIGVSVLHKPEDEPAG